MLIAEIRRIAEKYHITPTEFLELIIRNSLHQGHTAKIIRKMATAEAHTTKE
jgi:hypothetical protein